jgi:hypothetical protein
LGEAGVIGPENSLAIRKPLELDIQTAMREARRFSMRWLAF